MIESRHVWRFPDAVHRPPGWSSPCRRTGPRPCRFPRPGHCSVRIRCIDTLASCPRCHSPFQTTPSSRDGHIPVPDCKQALEMCSRPKRPDRNPRHEPNTADRTRVSCGHFRTGMDQGQPKCHGLSVKGVVVWALSPRCPDRCRSRQSTCVSTSLQSIMMIHCARQFELECPTFFSIAGEVGTTRFTNLRSHDRIQYLSMGKLLGCHELVSAGGDQGSLR